MGGLGTRLGDITKYTTKSMVDIYNKPFFYYQLNLLKWYGFKNFLFCVGYKGDSVENFFGDGSKFGVSIKYSYDGEKLLGTAGALRKALPFLYEDFIVIYGDAYLDINYPNVINTYYNLKRNKSIKALMTLYKNKNNFARSNAIYKDGKFICYDKFNRSPQMEYIDYGVSIFSREVIEKLAIDQFIDLADIVHNLVESGDMAGFKVDNRFYEIGTLASLEEFKEFIYNRFYVLKPTIFLDRDGTLNKIIYNDDIEQLDSPLKPKDLELLPNIIESLNILKSLGYLLIIVTNQPAAAKGKTSLNSLFEVNKYLIELLKEGGVSIDDILICPHHPIGSDTSNEKGLIKKCSCRKPENGLLEKAIKKFNIDRKNSFMVGDSYVDILAGKKTNVKTVFLGRFKCDFCQLLNKEKPDYVFSNLYEFAQYIKKEKRIKN